MLLLFSVPGLVLFVYNLGHSASGGTLFYGDGLAWNKLRNLAFPIRSSSRLLDVVFLAGLVVLLYLAYRTRRPIVWQKSWMIICAAMLLVYIATPRGYGLGGFLDVRVMPFLYACVLAALRINISRAMMAVMVLLAVVHIADMESIFISKQHELEGLTTAFQAIPRDARVLPLIRLKPGGTLIGQGEIHHVAYGVIQQGYLVPTIAYLPGLQPLRVVGAGTARTLSAKSWIRRPRIGIKWSRTMIIFGCNTMRKRSRTLRGSPSWFFRTSSLTCIERGSRR